MGYLQIKIFQKVLDQLILKVKSFLESKTKM